MYADVGVHGEGLRGGGGDFGGGAEAEEGGGVGFAEDAVAFFDEEGIVGADGEDCGGWMSVRTGEGEREGEGVGTLSVAVVEDEAFRAGDL